MIFVDGVTRPEVRVYDVQSLLLISNLGKKSIGVGSIEKLNLILLMYPAHFFRFAKS